MTTQPVSVVDVHRDATEEDAQILGAIWKRLTDHTKQAKKSARAVSEAWIAADPASAQSELIEKRNTDQARLDTTMLESWDVLQALPKGTCVGKATRQTVALEFFNRDLNRDLRQRMTAAQARKANALSFGV
jgi:ArsR family metal-binding transcriptional regulator